MSHLSSFDLDALALDALSAGDAARARAHLEACDACRAERDAAAALRDEFLSGVLVRSLPRRRIAWWKLAVPALAAAAALVVVLAWPRREPELGIKGTAAWHVYAQRGDQQFVVHDGTRLAPGDRIRFVVTPNGARYVMIASLDGAGVASIYYASQRIEGARAELPDSIVLDAAPGPERLFALFSDEPLGDADVTAKLRAIRDLRATGRLDVTARAQLTLVFEKVQP